MAKNQTLNASIRLNSNAFKKGVKDIQRSLNSLKSTFLGVAGALGAGLGFGRLVSSIKDTTVALNSAEVTLKNVSTGINEYADSLDFLKRISEDYGQDQLALTQSFAKFRAAAAQTNLTIDQQRTIFESLTRAAGAYNMSTDQTRNAMMAVEQMLSKSRVTAEELRRQLGNALPGAFNMMAVAAGAAGITTHGTTAELEKAMKEGKVLSEQVLPHFAKVLDEVTKTAKFNSLQNNLARLKNSWTEFTRSSEFQDMYQGIIKATTNLIKFITKNMNTIKTLILGTFGGAFAGKGYGNLLQKGNQYYDDLTKKAQKLTGEANKYLKELEKIEDKYDKNVPKNTPYWAYPVDVKANGGKHRLGGAYVRPEMLPKGTKLEEKDIKVLQKYNRALIELQKTEQKLGYTIPRVSQEALRSTERLQTGGKQVESGIKSIEYSTTRFQKIGAGLRVLGTNVGNTIKGMLTSMAAGALIGAAIAGITALISHFVKLKKEADAIKNTVSDMEKKVKDVGESVSENTTAQKLIRLKIALENINKEGDKANLSAKKALLGELNKTLGRTGDKLFTIESKFEDVTSAVDNYIGALKYAAMQQAIVTQVGEKTAEILKLNQENLNIMQDPNYGKKVTQGYGLGYSTWEELTPAATKLENTLEKNNKKIDALQKGIENLLGPLATNPDFIGPIPAWQANADTLRKIYGDTSNGDDNTGPGDGGKAAKGAQKAFEDYTEAVDKLNNKLKEGVITEKDYNKELFKIIRNAKEEAAQSGELSIDDIMGKINSNKALTELEEWYQDLFHNSAIYAMKVLDYENEELGKQFEADLKDEINDLDLEGAIQERLDALSKLKMPKLNAPDTWDNYKQSDSEIWKENADALQDYADELKELLDDLKELGPEGQIAFDKLKEGMDKISESAKNMRDKARVEEWKQDIKKLQEEFNSGLYSSVKNVAQGFERLYDTFKDLSDKMDEAEGIEQVILAFETLFDVLETGMAIYEGIKNLSEISAKLKKAQASEEMLDLEKQVAARTALAAADATEGAAAVSAEAAKAAAVKTTTAAMKEAATATAAQNAMMVPYPANLAALAQNLAAVTAAFAAGKGLQAFANGGIVNGPTTGDRNLIRANGGELVATTAQQKRLMDILDGKAPIATQGGKVDFVIQGAALKGVLQNYNSRLHG